ncbi:TetR family transcriptional regulator [Amycolatopsis sp. cmx-11-51]|uniref:TetR family transcriptional regulator n=1 Tax=unclassified Amycolatopsis TaxID=2618356 RepID=UPI0039E2AD71
MTIMSEVPSAAVTGGPYHEPIVASAIELTVGSGWSSVTMSKLADIVGVSRQTVYNELGSKSQLAEAMISHELARFLSVVRDAFGRHPDDLVEAIHDAVRGVLELADDNLLLRAIVSATHGADTELLPLLTVRAGSLLSEATIMLRGRVRAYDPPLDPAQLGVAIDVVVRTVLSHIMQPSDTPARTADALAWMASRVLGTTTTRSLRHPSLD